MAKALETLFADFKPSALQQAAIDRIKYFQRKLQTEYGMFVRSGIELEFFYKDRQDVLISPAFINLDKALAYFRDKEGLSNVSKYKSEGPLQREIIIGDEIPAPEGIGHPKDFSPNLVAFATEHLKQRSIRNMLVQTTCLNTPGHYAPVFDAYAYPNANPMTGKEYKYITSALHVNVSLYDKNGKNLFAEFPILAGHCANSLMVLQNEAGLSMLPSSKSLTRLGINTFAPGGIGMEDPNLRGAGVANYNSVAVRSADTEIPSDVLHKNVYDHFSRIENRLPGADADPFVSMAVTMAALVDALEKNVTKVETKIGTRLKVACPNTNSKWQRYEIPKTHSDIVLQFTAPAHKRHLTQLLGSELYNGILDAYHKPAERAR